LKTIFPSLELPEKKGKGEVKDESMDGMPNYMKKIAKKRERQKLEEGTSGPSSIE